jgi:hypothetical protein
METIEITDLLGTSGETHHLITRVMQQKFR